MAISPPAAWTRSVTMRWLAMSCRGEQPRGARKHAAFAVRGHAAGDHQPDPAPRPRGVEFGDAVPVAGLLQPGVHRPHQHPVFQGDMAQIKRGKQMRIGSWNPPDFAEDAPDCAPCHLKRGVTLWGVRTVGPPHKIKRYQGLILY